MPPSWKIGSANCLIVEFMVVVVPLTVKLPPITTAPPTFNAPPIPTPPVTIKAPVPVVVEAVVFVIEIAVAVVAPLAVTLASVSLFAGAAPMSARVHETLAEPLTDLPVLPIVNVLAVVHVSALG